MVTRIYDRPDLDQRRGMPALYVSGTLPNGKPGVAYEGRLQIHNAVGACTVEQIDGDTLPPGHSIYVDNSTAEVVITWPAYVEQAAPIQNPGFEDGMSGWAAGAGWSVTTNNAITGSRSAVYQRNGGSSVISSQSRYPVNPGVPISAQCQVRQGASSAGNAGAGLRLEFRDAAGDVIGWADGNYVMSASKNAVYPSNVSARPPAGVATVNIACVGVRHRENKDVWVDSFSWDHKVAVVGINAEAVFNLILRVRDSAGRSALWQGEVFVGAVATLYDLILEDQPWAYWVLADIAGSTSAEEEVSSRSLAAINSPNFGAPGLVPPESSISLNGTSQRLQSGNNQYGAAIQAAFNGDKSFSIEAVVELSTIPANGTILHIGNYSVNPSQGLWLTIRSDLSVGVGNYSYNSGDWQYREGRTQGAVVSVGQKVHILATRNHQVNGGEYRIYVNGMLLAQGNIPGQIGAMATTSLGGMLIAIGVRNGEGGGGNPSSFFPGKIAHCVVYDRVVPAERVLLHAKAAGVIG